MAYRGPRKGEKLDIVRIVDLKSEKGQLLNGDYALAVSKKPDCGAPIGPHIGPLWGFYRAPIGSI